MKAMILAGGLSTRLYPLTKQVPKPLVPVAGEPNSAHILRYLAAHGIAEVAINVFYLAEEIVSALGDGSAYGSHLEYLHESVLMGSAGGMKQLESYLRDGTFVVVGCDGLTNIDLSKLIAFHKERGALATIALVREEDVTQYGVVIVDERRTHRRTSKRSRRAAPSDPNSSTRASTSSNPRSSIAFRRASSTISASRSSPSSRLRERGLLRVSKWTGAYWVRHRHARRNTVACDGRRALRQNLAKGRARDRRAAECERSHATATPRGRRIASANAVRIGPRGVRLLGPTVIGDDVTHRRRRDDAPSSIVWDGLDDRCRRGRSPIRDRRHRLHGRRRARSSSGAVVANEPASVSA